MALFLGVLISCTSNSNRGDSHYDTSQVDTMLAINLDSGETESSDVVSVWTYNADSTEATIVSAPNGKSQLSKNNRMTIRIFGLGTSKAKACLVLGNGERFAGNSFDTTNIVRVYAQNKELASYQYFPGITKQLDSAYISSSRSLISNLQTQKSFKIETSTFTSGSLVYDFDAIGTLIK